MTWGQLADRITEGMLSGQLRDQVHFDASALAVAAVAPGLGQEEAPEEARSVIGIPGDPAGLEGIGNGDRMERYVRER
jgi:hypothetical protein